MQKDFHYYCTGVLARAAGFSPADALTIAYASQYVDSAIESEPIAVGDNGLRFDPVCTTYWGLHSLEWSMHKRVYIPFHFVPPEPFAGSPTRFDFVTRPDSPFAHLLLQEAASTPDSGELYCRGASHPRLCAIGIALHTFADTWSHQGFSGRRATSADGIKENDAEKLAICQDGVWKEAGFNLLDLFMPELGHAEAGFLPDLACCTWKCERNKQPQPLRDNLAAFMQAAETIYLWLRDQAGSEQAAPIPWEQVKPRIEKLLAEPSPDAALWNRAAQNKDLERRCALWEAAFARDPDFFYDPAQGTFEPYHFDKTAWRKEAFSIPDAGSEVKGPDLEWEELSRSQFKELHYQIGPHFWESRWVSFHRAALKQRHLVLENLP